MKVRLTKTEMELPDYYWEIQVNNNLTGELIRMVKRGALSDALEAATLPSDSDPISTISLVHRTEDTSLVATLIGPKLPEYLEDIMGWTKERVPARFRKEFKSIHNG